MSISGFCRRRAAPLSSPIALAEDVRLVANSSVLIFGGSGGGTKAHAPSIVLTRFFCCSAVN